MDHHRTTTAAPAPRTAVRTTEPCDLGPTRTYRHAKFALAAAAAIMLTGCGSSPKDFAEAPVTNKHGQTMTYVAEDGLHTWMKEHQNNKVIALTGYAGGKYGTSGYVIVFESAKPRDDDQAGPTHVNDRVPVERSSSSR